MEVEKETMEVDTVLETFLTFSQITSQTPVEGIWSQAF